MRIKDCYCCTCEKELHRLGVARHRAMHRDKKENCEILFGDGAVVNYKFEIYLESANGKYNFK